MQSVVMPSLMTTTRKNLFDGKLELGELNFQDGTINNVLNYDKRHRSINYISVKSNTNYTYSCNIGDSGCNWLWYDKDKKYINNSGYRITATSPSNAKYLKYFSGMPQGTNLSTLKVQIEESSTTTHKSNILTVNEDVELRGIGDVKDELNCLTGEVTERIGEYVLDGSDDETYGTNWNSNGTAYPCQSSTGVLPYPLKIIANVPIVEYQKSPDVKIGISKYGDNQTNSKLVVVASNEITGGANNSSGLKAYLQQNPIVIKYVKSTPTTKTVSTSIVDQDGAVQPKLQSYANGYITVSSQGLIPSVNYEVPTNNSYYLDLVKPNTLYTTKSSLDCNTTIDGVIYPLSANGTFTTPSTITDKLMVLDTPVNDLMFIEGDLTSRDIDYFTS